MSYVALAGIMLGVIYLLIHLSDKLEFLYFTNNKGEQIPFIKYLMLLVAGWLLVPVVNVGVKITETLSYPVSRTLDGFFKATLILMIVVTAFYMLGLLFHTFEWLGGVNE